MSLILKRQVEPISSYLIYIGTWCSGNNVGDNKGFCKDRKKKLKEGPANQQVQNNIY